jgi:hypothetical protein
VSKSYGRVSIGLGVLLLFAGALDARDHFAIWATSLIVFGLTLIVFGTSFFISGERKKFRRRVSLGFLGAALIFLAVALVVQS